MEWIHISLLRNSGDGKLIYIDVFDVQSKADARDETKIRNKSRKERKNCLYVSCAFKQFTIVLINSQN